jgi:hypothetical protein
VGRYNHENDEGTTTKVHDDGKKKNKKSLDSDVCL